MKAFKVLGFGLLMLSAMACSNDELSEVPTTEFKVVSAITPVSRAPQLTPDGGGHFMKGDVNTLFFHQGDGQLLQTFDYTYGSRYYWADVHLPAGVKSCQLSACYPPVKTSSPQHFEWDVRTAQTTADFLVAFPVDVQLFTSSTISLSFSHAMHNLAVELLKGDDSITDEQLNQATVICRNYQPVAVLNLLEGKAVAAKGEKTASEKSGKAVNFIIPAQSVGTMEVVVRMGDREGIFRLSDSQLNGTTLQQLESGKTLTLKIKVSKSSFTIVGHGISGWGSQGEFEDSIII